MKPEIYLDDSDLDILVSLYVLDEPLPEDSSIARGWVGNDLLAVRHLEQIGFVKHENNAYDLTNAGILHLINKDIV